jgi:hypothetical protein
VRRRLDSLDAGLGLWLDVSVRALQVFVAAMIVELAAGDFLPSARRIEFWQDLAGAAIIAGISQALALAGYRRNGPPAAPGCAEPGDGGQPGTTRPPADASPQDRSNRPDTPERL